MSATLSQPDVALIVSQTGAPAAPPAVAPTTESDLPAAISAEVARSLVLYGEKSPHHDADPERLRQKVDVVQARPEILRIRRLADTARLEIERAMAMHKKPALTFSGGKDSLACLYLLRPWWDRVTVLWANAGDPYPELVEQMQRVRDLVPHFVEVRGPGYVHRHGTEQTFPVDMIPLATTLAGRTIERMPDRFKTHSYLDCCSHNWWLPLHNKVNELGVDLLIRGDREDEQYRVPVHSGMKNPNGGTYLLPVQDWTEADVFMYLRAEGVEIPRWYAYGASSPDCLHCTAWLADGVGRWRYLRTFHPEAAAEVRRRMLLIQAEQQRFARHMEIALADLDTVHGEGSRD